MTQQEMQNLITTIRKKRENRSIDKETMLEALDKRMRWDAKELIGHYLLANPLYRLQESDPAYGIFLTELLTCNFLKLQTDSRKVRDLDFQTSLSQRWEAYYLSAIYNRIKLLQATGREENRQKAQLLFDQCTDFIACKRANFATASGVFGNIDTLKGCVEWYEYMQKAMDSASPQKY